MLRIVSCAVFAPNHLFGVLVLFLATGGLPATSFAQQPASLVRPASTAKFVDHVFKDESGEHRYVVYVPNGYQADRPSPAILFLHGAGERGSDNRLQLDVGLGPYLKARNGSFPFVVVFPQCEDMHSRLLGGWTAESPDGQRALKILDQATRDYQLDAKRTALIGWSMGGYGAWSLAAAAPEKFSAVVALSGGGNPATAEALKSLPIWAIHGEIDRLVPPAESRKMVEAVNAAGGTATLTELPGVGHDVFPAVFGTNAITEWLRDPEEAVPSLKPAPGQTVVVPAAPAFVPALEIPEAVAIRFGNKSLKALSYGMPSLVPANMLTGRLGDMFDSTTVSGRSFSIRFGGISYSAQLSRVEIQAFAPDRLSIQLGVVNGYLMIGGTSISGARHSAQAGPITIYVGHNGPVWLLLDVTPYVDPQTHRVKLRLNGASFPIPAYNYSVSAPAGVAVQGFGMTQDRVVDGLTSGLYGARGRVESQVVSIAPQIVAQLEEQLKFPDSSPFLAGVWPLPVYAPRVRLWPQTVQTDAGGISVILGMTAAAYDPHSKPELKTAKACGANLDTLKGEQDLRVALAPGVLEPLTQLVVDRDLAQLDLLDVPNQAFAPLTERPLLEEIIPALKQVPETSQVRVEFALREAMQATEDKESGAFQLRLPKAELLVSTQAEGSQKWEPFARFDLTVAQTVLTDLKKPAYDVRQIQLSWDETPEVTAEGAFVAGIDPADKTLHIDRLSEEFVKCWKTWTQASPAAEAQIPDVAFGLTKLRVQDVDWKAPVIAARLTPAGVRVTNSADVPFTYETKGPYSGWGGPYTLQPGKSHQFDIPFPLIYRRSTPTGQEVYTLGGGTHSEFRVPKKGGPPQLFQANPTPVVEKESSAEVAMPTAP